MKRLHYVNLVGVLALAALCVVQWQRDRRLNLEVNRLEQTRFDQAAKLAEQEQTVLGLTADLAQFKEQFKKAQAELAATLQQLHPVQRQTNQLAVERDQLKTSVTNWANAVAARDERLKEATAETRRLAADLNTSIRKYNELATNHNALVKDLNDLRARLPQPQPPQQPAPRRTPQLADNSPCALTHIKDKLGPKNASVSPFGGSRLKAGRRCSSVALGQSIVGTSARKPGALF